MEITILVELLVYAAIIYTLRVNNFSVYAPLRFLGIISYSIYFTHPIALALNSKLKFTATGGILNMSSSSISAALICLATVLVISSTTYYVIERPFLKMRKYFK